MLKISVIDSHSERQLVLEGKLVEPWTAELRNACEQAREDLEGRDLLINLKQLTVISFEGQALLASLMAKGFKFRPGNVFAKQVMRQVADTVRMGLQPSTS